MTDNSTRRPVRLRTFASDLEAKRGQDTSGTPAATKAAAVSLPEVAEKPAFKAASHAPEKTDINISSASSLETLKTTFTKPVTAPVERPTPPRETVTSASSKIPAFHELKKKANTIQENITAEVPDRSKKHKQKTKAKTTPTRPNIGYDAAVITDTVSNRFQLFPSVIASFRSWLKQLGEKRARKKVPTYSVPETERRKGVIQRATTKTGTIFSADSDTLREQIRRRQQQSQETTDDETETIWTPFTEAGFPLLEAPDAPVVPVQNVTIEYRQRPQIVVPTNDIPVVPSAPDETAFPVTITEPTPTLTADEERWVSDASAETRADELPDLEDQYEQVQRVAVEDSTGAETQDVPLVTKRRGRLQPLSLTDTNTLTVIILVGIIATITTVFVAYTIFFKNADVADTAVVPLSEPVLTSATLVGVTLTVQSLTTVPDLINAAVASSSAGLIEYAVVSSTGEEISPAYLFEILGFKTLPVLRQSLTAMRFASVNQSKPIIVLEFVDVDTVRGGLLDWESTLAEDLAGLYDIDILSPISFTDETVAGIDARILRDEEQTFLIYGIVDERITLIAPNFADFAQVVDLLRSE